MKTFKTFALALFAILLLQACQKEIPVSSESSENLQRQEKIEAAKASLTAKEKSFFDPDFAELNNPNVLEKLGFRTNEDSLITVILETVLLQNKEEPFVPDLIDELGYPFWGRGVVYPVDDDPTHHLAAIPWAKLDEDFTSAVLFSLLGEEDPYFFLVQREELMSFLGISKAEDKENARFLIGSFVEFDYDLFGVKDTLLFNAIEDLDNNVKATDDELSFRCGSYEITIVRCVTYAVRSETEDGLEFRYCPPGTEPWPQTIEVVVPCYPSGNLSFPIDHSTVFQGGQTDWWSAAGGGGSHGSGSVLPIPISNPTLNSLGIQTLDVFLDACGSQGEPGSPANDPAVGALCAKIKEIAEVIPLGSAEMAWLLGNGAVNAAVLNFFATWIPTHNLPANIELAAAVIQLYSTAKIDISKGFHSINFAKVSNLMTELGLNADQAAHLFANPELIPIIENLYNSVKQGNPTEEELFHVGIAAQILLETNAQNLFDIPISDELYDLLSMFNAYFPNIYGAPETTTGNPVSILIGPSLMHAREILEETFFLRLENPLWDVKTAYLIATYRVLRGTVHTGLDIIGLIPGLGEPADLVNGILYVLDGDWGNASFSFGSTIPIAGWASTGAKWATILITVGSKTYKLRHYIKNGIVTFSHTGRLREILGMKGVAAYDNFQAHHVIPEQFWNHPVVQKAAQAKNNSFHINSPQNGIPVEITRHNGPHDNYNTQILTKLNALGNNISPQAAADELKQWQINYKNVISSSSSKVNDLTLP